MQKRNVIRRGEDQGDGRRRYRRAFALIALITAASALGAPSSAHATCSVGDCNVDNQVTVDEINRCTAISLGEQPLSYCPACDSNHDGEVTVDEIIAAVNLAQTGCPVCTANVDQQSQSCGTCGTQTRTCNASGQWGAWGACTGSGQQQSQSCNACGTQTRTCGSGGNWTAWGACTGNGQQQSQGCGNCGNQTRSCNSSGNWTTWGSCTGQGVCTPGASTSLSCGAPGSHANNKKKKVCNNSCQWDAWQQCACDPPVANVNRCTPSSQPAGNFHLKQIANIAGCGGGLTDVWEGNCGRTYRHCGTGCPQGWHILGTPQTPNPAVDHCSITTFWTTCEVNDP